MHKEGLLKNRQRILKIVTPNTLVNLKLRIYKGPLKLESMVMKGKNRVVPKKPHML